MINFSDTICAVATSVGSGAISIIRVSGPDTHAICDKVVRFKRGTVSTAKGYTLRMGDVRDIDEVLVSIFRAPHSYTGEDSVELACHASPYIVSQILERLQAAGCRLALPGEFTQRAFANGKMDLAQAEAVADLIASSSQAQHRIARKQLRGGYSHELEVLRAKLVELSALMELELDFSEEEIEFADRDRLNVLLNSAIERCSSLADSFRVGNAIKNGVPVAIVGAPNSGKSTLLNALLQEERAIVSSIPGTTRDTIEETCIINGILYRFIDTAGLRESDDEIEQIGIKRAIAKAAEAEIILAVVDASAEDIVDQVDKIGEYLNDKKAIMLLNKSDLAVKGPETGSNKNVRPFNYLVSSVDIKLLGTNTLEISAKHGTGLKELKKKIVSMTEMGSSEGVLVTNARHAAALRDAEKALKKVRKNLNFIPADLLCEDLREAIKHLGTITGQITSDEVLGEIFGKFCIGK